MKKFEINIIERNLIAPVIKERSQSQINPLSCDHTRLESPQIDDTRVFMTSVLLELWLDQSLDFHLESLLNRSLHIDVLAIGSGIVARNGLSKALRAISARAVNEKRVKEDRVAFLHLQMRQLDFARVYVLYAVVHLVHAAFPFRVVVF